VDIKICPTSTFKLSLSLSLSLSLPSFFVPSFRHLLFSISTSSFLALFLTSSLFGFSYHPFLPFYLLSFLPSLPSLSYAHEDWQSRLSFGLKFTTKIPISVSARLLKLLFEYWGKYGVVLKQSVTPLFGKPLGYKYGRREALISKGDEESKKNAREMMRVSAEERKMRDEESEEIPRNLLK
jgi:hypothetical protein